MSDVSFRRGRWLAFVGVLFTSVWSVLRCRSIGRVGSIGVGLNAGLSSILALNLMLLHDPRSFKRLRLKDGMDLNSISDLRHDARVEWESMPQSLYKRFWWILDLLTSLRAPHWNSSLAKYRPFQPDHASRPPSGTSSLSRDILRFLVDYMALDLTKCLKIEDPYFLGFPRTARPIHFIRFMTSSMAIYTYRMALCAFGVFIAIDLLFVLAVLVQVHILGQRICRLNASPPLYPPVWGIPWPSSKRDSGASGERHGTRCSGCTLPVLEMPQQIF